MQYIIIVSLLILAIILLKIVFQINIKELKKIGEENEELDNLVKKYPSNKQICQEILNKIGNNSVQIQEKENTDTSLYIAITNKIIIANLRQSFTRIQTIAHECLHSIQDRKILLTNYFYSLFYLVYFYTTIILGILNKIPNKMLFLCIQILLSYIYFFFRSYLENDAMIKARFLSEEYMKEKKISNQEEIDQIVKQYDRINEIGIKTINLSIFANTMIRTLIIILVIILLRHREIARKEMGFMSIYPDAYLKNVKEITLDFLKQNNIKALILDVDNTLIDYYKNLSEDTVKWAKELKQHGIKIYILSNTNKKSKVEKVAKALDVPYKMFAKKPSKKGFLKIKEELKIKSENIGTVGDQIFTDVIGGNRCNMFTILVDPVTPKDFWYTAWKRPLENLIKKRLSIGTGLIDKKGK